MALGQPIHRPFGRQNVELPVWFALLAVGAIGALFGYLFFSRRAGGGAIAGATPPIQINNYAGGYAGSPPALQPMAAISPGLRGGAMPSPATRFETFTLSATAANTLFMATGGHRWRVKVRVVSPPGSFAMFAPEASVLANTGVMQTRAIIVPAGGEAEVFLLDGNRLYGRGNVAGVIVSMTASVEATEALG